MNFPQYSIFFFFRCTCVQPNECVLTASKCWCYITTLKFSLKLKLYSLFIFLNSLLAAAQWRYQEQDAILLTAADKGVWLTQCLNMKRVRVCRWELSNWNISPTTITHQTQVCSNTHITITITPFKYDLIIIIIIMITIRVCVSIRRPSVGCFVFSMSLVYIFSTL